MRKSLAKGNAGWTPTPEQQAWLDAVAQLPARQQVEAVARKMPLTSLQLYGMPVDVWSLAAGKKLKSLHMSGMLVPDISFIKSLPLEDLTLEFRPYFEPDEKLLRSMPLKTINNMPAEQFWAKLAQRRKADEAVAALIAKLPGEKTAEGLRAEFLKHGNDPQVKVVQSEDGAVVEVTIDKRADVMDILVPLRAFPRLRKLTIAGGKYQRIDLSPLLGLPLEEINCGDLIAANVAVLRAMPKLKTIDGKPADLPK